MRNVFDQYEENENRLTHALAVCLNEDRDLLAAFVVWVGARSPAAADQLEVLEQSLPGELVVTEEDPEGRGLPDIVISRGDWCILVESKIQARLVHDQLARHRRTLERRGFREIVRVALTKASVSTPPDVVSRKWYELYEWLDKVRTSSKWPARLREYLRVAEVRLARKNYLTEGTLTMFDGFKFSKDNPYTYGEAKRLLKLAMAELRGENSLLELGVDPEADQRESIKGSKGNHVWDYLQLRGRRLGAKHTNEPHLTLALHVDHLEASLSIPDKIDRAVKRRLVGIGEGGLLALHSQIVENSQPIRDLGGWAKAFAIQRHYKNRNANPTLDAKVEFKLETSVRRQGSRVKFRREWSSILFNLMQPTDANIHLAYAIHFPWETKGLDSRDALKLIVQGWIALKPVLDVLRQDSPVNGAVARRSR